MIQHSIKEGLTTTYKRETTVSDSVTSSETMALDFLLSTPAVLSMIIEASSRMLDPLVPAEYITVGKNIELSHEHPTIIGSTVSLVLKVINVEKNTIVVTIEGHDDEGIFCRGKHERAIVSRAKLLEIAYKRSPNSL
ncbi:thioesterase family protein [Sinanaerobacter chloroacetimidivorans]|jgi:fluoroacetyl-CoA thioesterase|uniref:Fluoroacetyl-CoA-specific thioesterase-like domain-containing protein n=1 Tax=Sinanaerobacter chloroacetimidivorans TaxID=2818044 RepID=A0A8J7W0W8_9FIRM|nr:hotdog domain-containing protein [Sinanaerobacter chloroacetimidivorans]MBR0596915.1 hypothetical protein [Sinanaerobacter chloroacetimidivorans]